MYYWIGAYRRISKETLLGSYFCKSKCQIWYLGFLYMKLSLLIPTFYLIEVELFLEVRFPFCEKFPLRYVYFIEFKLGNLKQIKSENLR